MAEFAWYENAVCDVCGNVGAYDMGDSYIYGENSCVCEECFLELARENDCDENDGEEY